MAWYDAEWPKRFAITVDHTLVLEAVDNIYYDLSLAPADFWALVSSDGGDVRVTQSDGTTERARELSGFNSTSDVGSLYISVSDLSTSVDRTYYVYYGNTSAIEPADTDIFGKRAVWGSHIGIWHLDGGGSTATDSKAGNNGTQSGGVTPAVTAKLRTGFLFDGVDDKLTVGDLLNITTESLTFSAWVNPSGYGESGLGHIIDKSGSALGYQFRMNSAGTNFQLAIGNGTSLPSASANTGSITLSTMQWLAVTYDGANARFYKNGSSVGSPAFTTGVQASTAVLAFGNNSGSNIRTFNGIIDEIRMSTSVRSSNWIATEYNNQNSPSTFWTTGSAESDVAPPAPITDLNAVALTSTQVNLTWTPSVGTSSHRIERATVG